MLSPLHGPSPLFPSATLAHTIVTGMFVAFGLAALLLVNHDFLGEVVMVIVPFLIWDIF